MNDKKELQVVAGVPPVEKKSLLGRVAVGAGTVYALALTAPAHAEGMFAPIYASFKTEMEAAKADMIAMWGVAGLVLIGFAIWRYTKRGANSA